MKFNVKNILLLVLVVVIAISVFSFIDQARADKTDFTYGDIKQLFKENAVIECTIDGDLVAHIKAYEVRTDDKGKLLKNNESGTLDYVGFGDPATVKEYTFELTYNYQLEKIDELAEECTL